MGFVRHCLEKEEMEEKMKEGRGGGRGRNYLCKDIRPNIPDLRNGMCKGLRVGVAGRTRGGEGA